MLLYKCVCEVFWRWWISESWGMLSQGTSSLNTFISTDWDSYYNCNTYTLLSVRDMVSLSVRASLDKLCTSLSHCDWGAYDMCSGFRAFCGWLCFEYLGYLKTKKWKNYTLKSIHSWVENNTWILHLNTHKKEHPQYIFIVALKEVESSFNSVVSSFHWSDIAISIMLRQSIVQTVLL